MLKTVARRILPPSARTRLFLLWTRYLRWPMPLWRARGKATVQIGGSRFTVVGMRGDTAYFDWAYGTDRKVSEAHAIDRFASLVQPGDTVLDVGAHVGGYALLASCLVGPAGRVYAFDPDPDAQRLLQANLAANDITNVTVVPLAISNQPGQAHLDSRHGDSTSRLSDAGNVAVQADTLDAFCGREHITPDVIKVDVEGAETLVLDPVASRESVRAARAVLVEIHQWAGVQFEDIAGPLRAVGKDGERLGQRGQTYHVAFT